MKWDSLAPLMTIKPKSDVSKTTSDLGLIGLKSNIFETLNSKTERKAHITMFSASSAGLWAE